GNGMPVLRFDEVAEETVCFRVRRCRECRGAGVHWPTAFLRTVWHGQAAFALNRPERRFVEVWTRGYERWHSPHVIELLRSRNAEPTESPEHVIVWMAEGSRHFSRVPARELPASIRCGLR